MVHGERGVKEQSGRRTLPEGGRGLTGRHAGRALVWFRSDLRTRDHTALHAACADRSERGVVGLFILCADQWRRHEYAPARVDFILRTLGELSAALREINIPLVIIECDKPGAIPDTVLGAARLFGCDRVHFNAEHEVDERRRDEAAAALLAKHGVRAVPHSDQCLFEPGTIRTGEGGAFTVFTPFKNAVMRALQERGRPAVLPAPRKQADTGIASTEVPRGPQGFSLPEDEKDGPHEFAPVLTPKGAAALWPAGEKEALKRLGTFCRGPIGQYEQCRDAPGIEGTSRLSPYLTVGAISHRQCLAASMEDHADSQWVVEILWREFYIHVMAAFPRVCMGRAFRQATERIRWNENEEHERAWREGRTGVPIVDAGMRQLLREGWMHNRVRMIVAMFLTKNLFLDWRRGESWFMRNLIDGFFASNNGGWQWSAGTGTDAAPYFRVFNPVSQSRRVDPEGRYIKKHVPELRGLEADEIHAPWEMPPLKQAAMEYPRQPIVDLSESRKRAIEAFRALGT